MRENPFIGATAPVGILPEDGGAYYDYMLQKGLDLAAHGDWQEHYARMLDRTVGLAGRRVLDLGAAMGALTVAMLDLGADVWGIELNRHLVERTPFTRVRQRLILGDLPTVLPILRDSHFDVIHASQTLEHIDPVHQPAIFRECHRLLKAGGLLFAAMPMREPPEEGTADHEDPSHLCVRPKGWWEQFLAVGFRLVGDAAIARFEREPMMQEYRWDYLLWECQG